MSEETMVVDEEVVAGYFDFASTEGLAEEIPDALESPEIGERKPWVPETPGKYVNASRTLDPKDGFKARKRADGHYGFLFRFNSGIQDPNTGKSYGTGPYPFKLYLDTKPQQLNEWNNGVPTPRLSADGKELFQSKISAYLRRFRDEDGKLLFDPKTKSLAQIAEMVEKSLSLPVGVVVGWREKTPKNEDGTYPQNYKHITKTRDYLVNGVYTPSIELNGVVYKAQSYIIDFCAVPVKES